MSFLSIFCHFLDLLWQAFGSVPVLGNLIASIGRQLCQSGL